MDKVIDDFNSQLLAQWQEKYKDDESALLPALLPNLILEPGLLFIGLNPSFSEKGFNEFKNELAELKEKKFEHIETLYSFKEYLSKKNRNDQEEVEKLIIQVEKVAKEKHSYFKVFKDISKRVFEDENKWEHIDLFPWRSTKQNDVKKAYIYQSSKKNDLNDFARKLLEEIINILKYIKPNVIVVSNACASDILKEKLNPTFNDKTGYHKIKIDNDNVPIFFSSMLTGQRALDNHSKERLIWHIKQTIETKS